MTIGTKIYNLRNDKRLSQAELEGKLGIATRTLGSIESGETKKIDFLLMDKICKEFAVDADYFKADTKLKQVFKDNSVGYTSENQIFNISDKLIEQYEERIKELKERIAYFEKNEKTN